jgi:OHCU decarboxylase
MALDLVTLNQLPPREFVFVTAPLFEHSLWIAERAASRRPFASIEAFHARLLDVVEEAGEEAQLALIRAHPDLAGKLAIAGELTVHSQAEQQSARLDRLTPEQFEQMTSLNAAYRSKFEFPFVICVRDHTQAGIFEAFRRRIANDRSAERSEALAQIGRIAWHRLLALMTAP